MINTSRILCFSFSCFSKHTSAAISHLLFDYLPITLSRLDNSRQALDGFCRLFTSANREELSTAANGRICTRDQCCRTSLSWNNCLSGSVEYYGFYKYQDKEIRKIWTSVNGLKKVFGVLDSTTSGLGGKPFPQNGVDAVNESIQSCEETLRKLQRTLAKVRTTTPLDLSILERLAGSARRATYPFRDGTLATLQDTVQDLRDNVNLTVTTLDLVVATRSGLTIQLSFVVNLKRRQVTIDRLEVLNTRLKSHCRTPF